MLPKAGECEKLRFKHSELIELVDCKLASLPEDRVPPAVKCVAWTTPQYSSFEKSRKDLGKKILLIHLPEVFDDLWVVRGKEVADTFSKEEIHISKQTKKLLGKKAKSRILKSKRLSKVVYTLPTFSDRELDENVCFFCGERSDLVMSLNENKGLGLCLRHHKALIALVDRLF
jgi:hypothetical protein